MSHQWALTRCSANTVLPVGRIAPVSRRGPVGPPMGSVALCPHCGMISLIVGPAVVTARHCAAACMSLRCFLCSCAQCLLRSAGSVLVAHVDDHGGMCASFAKRTIRVPELARGLDLTYWRQVMLSGPWPLMFQRETQDPVELSLSLKPGSLSFLDQVVRSYFEAEKKCNSD